jgi:acetyl esterase/lipase
VAVAFLLFSLLAVLWSYFAVARTHLWLFALVAGELALHHIVGQVAVGALFVWAGVLESTIGMVALALLVGAWAMLARAAWRGGRARAAIDDALAPLGIRPIPEARAGITDLALVRPRAPVGTKELRDVPYGDHPQQLLDLHLPESPLGEVPVLLQVHGGGWRGGNKERESRPLVFTMASLGWATASIGYRLSPGATFPDHLVDVKRAVAWVRDNLDAFGLTPGLVAITGGSAGAHLAALAALTGDDPSLQPGFEQADTTIDACVAFYGIYDLLNRNRLRPPWPFIARDVMKTSPVTDVGGWLAASPIEHVKPGSPPFFLLHGTHDLLVPRAESQQMVEVMRSQSLSPVLYAEIPGGTHGFDVFHSIRSRQVVAGVAAFLEHVRAQQHVAGRGTAGEVAN